MSRLLGRAALTIVASQRDKYDAVALDILEGRMIIEIGMAAVRPAEFIILKFSHKMAES